MSETPDTAAIRAQVGQHGDRWSRHVLALCRALDAATARAEAAEGEVDRLREIHIEGCARDREQAQQVYDELLERMTRLRDRHKKRRAKLRAERDRLQEAMRLSQDREGYLVVVDTMHALRDERDRARATAVTLEQELARVRDALTEMADSVGRLIEQRQTEKEAG